MPRTIATTATNFLKECTICKEVKVRNYREIKQGGRKFYKDENGLFWSGAVCPPCHNKRRMSYYYSSKEAKPQPSRPKLYFAPGTLLRTCQGCSSKTVNYRLCGGCLTELEEKTGFVSALGAEAIYCG